MPIENAYIRLNTFPTYRPEILLQQLDDLEEELLTGIERSLFVNRCNSFVTESGFTPGRGYVLLRGNRVSFLQSSINNTTHRLTFSNGQSEIIYSKLLVVRCEAITGGKGNTNDAIYLVELADLRILGSLTSINKAYNVQTPSGGLYNETTNALSAWTYEEMVDNIWGNMPGVFGSLNKAGADFGSGNPLYGDRKSVV